MKLLAGKMDKPDATIKPAGLGARDTLRLEAAMPLYGHELSETLDPLVGRPGLGGGSEQGLHRRRDALRRSPASGPKRKLVGLELEGRRIARQGTPVEAGRCGRRRSHQRHLQPDAPEEHRAGVRRRERRRRGDAARSRSERHAEPGEGRRSCRSTSERLDATPNVAGCACSPSFVTSRA